MRQPGVSDTVRTLVDDTRPSIVCLQKTKLDVITPYLVFSLLDRDFTEFAYLPASVTRGGILIAGWRSAVSFYDVLVGCFSVTLAVESAVSSNNDQDRWWLTSVYGPQDDNQKAIFLEELEAIRDTCSGPWMVTGDFNLILNEADKNNDRINCANLRRFRRTVASLGLQDVHLQGRCFTWSNERDSPTLVRLDRVLVSLYWDQKFPNAHLRGLGSDASDHCPLYMQTNMGQMTKARFHFESFWPKFVDFQETVVQAWQQPVNVVNPMARLDAMLTNLIKELQRWSATRIGDIKAQLIMAREIVLRLDHAQDARQLNEEEAGLRRRMKMKCLGLSSLERTMAREHSRIRQLRKGDANTSYFHLIARGRKRKKLYSGSHRGWTHDC